MFHSIPYNISTQTEIEVLVSNAVARKKQQHFTAINQCSSILSFTQQKVKQTASQ